MIDNTVQIRPKTANAARNAVMGKAGKQDTVSKEMIEARRALVNKLKENLFDNI